ncbi:MAG TPA: TRL domain-containing protein [Acidobacteriaceae bacterium]|nr:TRL domain-containing protein [Bradyrhizobium sp.]
MKNTRLFAVVLVMAVVLSGCIYAHVLSPLDTNVDRTVLGQKLGKASSFSVLGLVAWGDASTAAAAKNGGITTVNHMDREFTNIFFGVFTESTTIVYGD